MAAQKKNDASYGADDIQALEGLEPVRVRPGMYIGGTDSRGLHHLAKEIVDNSVDEALAGHCSEVIVEIFKDQRIRVSDNGRGIPVGINSKSGIPAVMMVFEILHAGGKFDGSGYAVSGGLHGVGASVTNALSEWLHVTVAREGNEWHAGWKKGVRTQELKKGKASKKQGTCVEWKPDYTIFPKELKHDPTYLARYLKEKAYLVRGLTFRLRTEDMEEQVFYSERGISEYVDELAGEREPLLKTPLHFTVDEMPVQDGMGQDVNLAVEVALQWTKKADERIYSFANAIPTGDGGTHVTGLKQALTKAMNNFAYETGKLKKEGRKEPEKFEGRDITAALTAAVLVKLGSPQFEGQTKGRLNNPEARSATMGVVYEQFSVWLEDKRNNKDAKEVLERCLHSRRVRLAQGKVSKNYNPNSIFADNGQSPKLADIRDSDTPVSERELFIVEGDSAGGPAKEARDSRHQAVLPLRGKPINTLTASNGKIFDNEEVKAIIAALGGRTEEVDGEIIVSLPEENMRFGKAIVCSVDWAERTFVKGIDGQIHPVRIGEFIDYVLDNSIPANNYQVQCVDFKTNIIHWKPLNAAIRHPREEPLHEISTQYGRSVRVTSSHSVFIWEDGKIVKREGHLVKKGDWLVMPKQNLQLHGKSPLHLDLVQLLHNTEWAKRVWIHGPSVAELRQSRVEGKNYSNTERVLLSKKARQRIKEIREEKGETLAATVEAIGVAQACSLSEWETGRSRISLATLKTLCIHLDIDYYNVLSMCEEEAKTQAQRMSNSHSERSDVMRQRIRLSELSADDIRNLGQDCFLTSEKHSKKIQHPRILPVNEDLMLLFGWFTAEGSYTKRGGVRLSLGPTDEIHLQEINQACQNIFGVKPRRYDDPTGEKTQGYELHIPGVTMQAVFDILGGFYKKSSHKKIIPQIVWNSTPDLQQKYLRGYFLGDGCCYGANVISSGTASEELANDLLWLLQSHGITAGVSKNLNKAGNHIYHFSICNKQNLRKAQIIWESKYSSSKITSNLHTIDLDYTKEKYSFDDVAELWDCSKNTVRKWMSRAAKNEIIKVKEVYSRQEVQALTQYRRKIVEGPKMLKDLEGNLSAVLVKDNQEVEPTNKFVYDFSVTDYENFICGVAPICLKNSDADTDGAHIANLVITMFHELFPDFIRQGRLHIANPPLYKIDLDARGDKFIYAYDDAERSALLKKHKRTGEHVLRFKGLGEMNADSLRETAIDPATRSVFQLTMEDAGEVANALNLIMGNKAEPRKKWLAEGGASQYEVEV